MPSQPIIFFLLFGGVQGSLFLLFLFHKKLYRKGYIFFLLYIGVMLLQITLKLMNKLWLMENWGLLYSLSQYLPLLYGTLAFLFVKDTLGNRPLTSKIFLHFLPFFFILSATLLHEYEMIPSALGYVLNNTHIRLVILSVSLVTYHLLAYRTWRQNNLLLKDYFSETTRFKLNWLRSFILLSFTVCLLVVAALYLLYINYPFGHEYRYGFAVLSIFIYWISYTALNQPVIFSVIKGHAETNDQHLPKLFVHRPIKKYVNSTLDEKEKNRICTALDSVIKENKIYLDADLTIDLLAEKISCSRHSLSQVLNECMKQSFYDYINHHRVEAAKILLADEGRKAHKIASIAYDAGFNSISTFNEVFKKMSGCTPSQFRRYPGEYFRFETFKRSVLEDPQIEHLTMGNHLPRLDYFGWIGAAVKFPDFHTKELQWNQLNVDYDFPKTFQLKFIAGRDFENGNRNDSNTLLMNESAVKALNQPIYKILGSTVTMAFDTGRIYKVIGVVKDFPFRSMHQPIEPLLIKSTCSFY